MDGDGIKRLYTIDEVTTLLNSVTAGLTIVGAVETEIIPLEEVARRTGWSLVTLERECQAGKIEHIGKGRSRGLTAKQLAKLIDQHRRGAGAKASSGAADPIEQARRATLAGAAKRTRRAA